MLHKVKKTILFSSLPTAILRFLSILAGVCTPGSALAASVRASTAAPLSFSDSFSSSEAFFTFLGTSTGRVALIIFFFALIIGFLRLLYGPKGVLRDPRWDELNEEFRAQENVGKAGKGKARPTPAVSADAGNTLAATAGEAKTTD